MSDSVKLNFLLLINLHSYQEVKLRSEFLSCSVSGVSRCRVSAAACRALRTGARTSPRAASAPIPMDTEHLGSGGLDVNLDLRLVSTSQS